MAAEVVSSTASYAGTPCVLADSLAGLVAAEIIVFVLHGFGANERDLSSLAPHIIAAMPGKRVRCVFPRAPLPLGPSSFAWWMIDIAAMQRSYAAGRFYADDTPAGLGEARALMEAVVAEATAAAGGAADVVLAGFSQGSMLAIELALHADPAPKALAVFSGALVNRREWLASVAERRLGFPVFQSHGRADGILPYAAGEALRDFFGECALEFEFVAFDGPHTVGAKALARLGAWLAEAVAPSAHDGEL